MKFLDTNGSMDIVEREDYCLKTVTITDSMLDLVVPLYIKNIQEQMGREYSENNCYLFKFICDNVSDEDILYTKNLVYEIVAEHLASEKLNKDWQPRPTLVEQLDANLRAQTIFLNHKITPQFLNVVFEKNNVICYNMIKKG